MLPAPNRIRTAEDFKKVIKRGVKVITPGAIIYILQEENSEFAAGFIVSKMVGNAVQRNRVKRKFRAIARNYFKDDIKLVVRARPKAKKFNYHELEVQFLKAVNDVKVS
ncbi:MAG: ribonuclease P protein component [Micrococcaceae bacterium]